MRWTRQRFARDGIAGLVERLVSDQQHADERRFRGRQNRVVLTARRWRQVRGVASAQPGLDKTYPLTTVAKEPGHRGEHDIRRKTIACGNAGRPGVLVVTRVRSTNTKCTRGCGCSRHPAFPTPSMGARDKCKPRARCAAGSRTRICKAIAYGIFVFPAFQRVVPANAGTHTARILICALEQRPFFTFEARGDGSLRSQGRPAESLCEAKKLSSLAMPLWIACAPGKLALSCR